MWQFEGKVDKITLVFTTTGSGFHIRPQSETGSAAVVTGNLTVI